MSLSFYHSVFLPVIAHPNDTKKKKERVTSHLPLIHPNTPFLHHPPSQAACSEGSIPMTAPTHTLPPLPPLKARE